MVVTVTVVVVVEVEVVVNTVVDVSVTVVVKAVDVVEDVDDTVDVVDVIDVVDVDVAVVVVDVVLVVIVVVLAKVEPPSSPSSPSLPSSPAAFETVVNFVVDIPDVDRIVVVVDEDNAVVVCSIQVLEGRSNFSTKRRDTNKLRVCRRTHTKHSHVTYKTEPVVFMMKDICLSYQR